MYIKIEQLTKELHSLKLRNLDDRIKKKEEEVSHQLNVILEEEEMYWMQ